MSGRLLLLVVVYVPAIHSWPSIFAMPPGMSLPPVPPGFGAPTIDQEPLLSPWSSSTSLLSVDGLTNVPTASTELPSTARP